MAKNRKRSGKRETRKSRHNVRAVARRENTRAPSFSYSERVPIIADTLRRAKRAMSVAELFDVLKTPLTGQFGKLRRVASSIRYDALYGDPPVFERDGHYVRLRKAARRGAGKRQHVVRGGKKGLKRAIGRSYVPADEKAALEKREPFAAEMDPDVIDRGRRGHARTQNSLANLVQAHGMEPLPPNGEPKFDVAWRDGDRKYVAEVKSLTKRNEEKQLRLGLGQVLRYRQLQREMEKSAEVWAVLALEREPSDKGWHRLCRELDVILWWPGAALPSITVAGTARQARRR